MERKCEGCHKCCDGWLWGKAHEHEFWPGRPCHFVGSKGCTIYPDRPHDPCVTFKCLWLKDSNIPEWMKPDQSNVILVDREKNGVAYIESYEAGARLDPKVLSWMFMSHVQGKIPNLKYQLDSGWNYIGSMDFINGKP